MERINHECYVSLEVAKLLKEAGFDWGCKEFWMRYVDDDGDKLNYTDEFYLKNGNNLNWNDNVHSMSYDKPDVVIRLSAPSLDVAQRWLREVKGFMVEMTFITDEYSILYQANLYEIESEKSKRVFSELISVVRGQSELKRTYEEAQEAGIKKALEIVLEKGE